MEFLYIGVISILFSIKSAPIYILSTVYKDSMLSLFSPTHITFLLDYNTLRVGGISCLNLYSPNDKRWSTTFYMPVGCFMSTLINIYIDLCSFLNWVVCFILVLNCMSPWYRLDIKFLSDRKYRNTFSHSLLFFFLVLYFSFLYFQDWCSPWKYF